MKILKKIRMTACALAAVAGVQGVAGVAQAHDWPDRPVKIIVAFGAGGTADVLARIIATELSASFKQQFYVENRAGATGAIGSKAVARSEPDGNTLLLAGSANLLVGPAVNKDAGYDPMRDFTHIAMLAGDSYMLVASRGSGISNLADLAKMAHDNPVGCGSAGAGSQGHLTQQIISRETGIELSDIPFNSAAASLTALLGNHIPTILQPTLSVGEQVLSKQIVPVAVTSKTRIDAYRDVPTFVELGYNVDVEAWFWLAGPAGMPPDIVKRLNTEVRRIIDQPNIKKLYAQNSFLTMDSDAARTRDFIDGEVKRWSAMVP